MALVQVPTPVVSADKTIAQIATGSLTSGTSLSLTGLASYDTLRLRVNGITTNVSTSYTATINNSSAGVYDYLIWGPTSNTTTSYDGAEMMRNAYDFNTSSIPISITREDTASDSNNYFQIDFRNCKSTGFTFFEAFGRFVPTMGSTWRQIPKVTGTFKTAAGVTSIQFNSVGTFTAGNYVLFGG